MELPPKANGRSGFHESAILLLWQDMVAGTTLPLFPAPACLPCPAIFQARPWKTTNKGAKIKYTISQNSCLVNGEKKKIP
jgi:hypothetical protein